MNVYYIIYFALQTLSILVQVSSSSDECPPWFILDITNNFAYPQCVCSQAMDSMITCNCNQRQRTSYVKVGHCAHQYEMRNETVVAYCPYIYPLHLIHNGLIRLPYNVTELNKATNIFYVGRT